MKDRRNVHIVFKCSAKTRTITENRKDNRKSWQLDNESAIAHPTRPSDEITLSSTDIGTRLSRPGRSISKSNQITYFEIKECTSKSALNRKESSNDGAATSYPHGVVGDLPNSGQAVRPSLSCPLLRYTFRVVQTTKFERASPK